MAPLTGDDDNRTGDVAELKTLVKVDLRKDHDGVEDWSGESWSL